MTLDEWRKAFEDGLARTVAQDYLDDGGMVSTMWIGLNHGFTPGMPTGQFESMIFPECEWCRRSSSRDEALQNHARGLAIALSAGRRLVEGGKPA